MKSINALIEKHGYNIMLFGLFEEHPEIFKPIYINQYLYSRELRTSYEQHVDVLEYYLSMYKTAAKKLNFLSAQRAGYFETKCLLVERNQVFQNVQIRTILLLEEIIGWIDRKGSSLQVSRKVQCDDAPKIISGSGESEKLILSFKEAARYLNLSESTLYKKTSAGEISHFKPNGKKIYFKKDTLDAYLLRNHIKSNEEIEITASTRVTLRK